MARRSLRTWEPRVNLRVRYPIHHLFGVYFAYAINVEPEITIVLSPVITIPRHEDRATRFIREPFMLLVV